MLRRPILASIPLLALAVPAAAQEAVSHVRVNQVGYLPDAPKVAVVCSLQPRRIASFTVVDEGGRRVLGPARARADRPFGPCASTHRLDFSALREPGRYRVVADGASSPLVRIAADVYAGGADTLLHYMRQQRSGFNPFFRLPVHTRTDGILVDHPRAGEFIPVAGGWADAADYLQYVTTSANATFVMLMAARDHPGGFADDFDANGLPGANGLSDALDEARHGLEWLVKMFPNDSLLLNQLGDDRDHAFLDLPPTDSSDYGWGRGRFRPVYPCTGRPQGIVRAKNRAAGYASTAGKYASAMALGARLFEEEDSAFAALLARKARAAYELGREHPGACQTAPGGAPYFYEEDNWVDDMELGAAQLHALTGEARYLAEAREYAAREPVTPWMGADTANHYQWYPWHNNGHHELWRQGDAETKREMAGYYRRGLEAVAARADNGFRVGIPFIWCSNNLMASFATQAYLYRRMTGDERFREHEQAALDWLFGANPWGVSMIVGYPAAGVTARHPHSVMANQIGVHTQLGGMLDGPVYRNVFQNLRGIRLIDPDEYAPFNTGFVVYHDDFGDYSTNEPIMDGTANLTYLLSALAPEAGQGDAARSLFDGRTLAGWEISDFGASGQVEVKDGAIVLGTGDPMTGITWKGSFPRTGYEVTLEAKRVAGADFFSAITFPVGEQPCTLVIGGWGGSVVGLSSIEGADASENETRRFVAFENDRWYRVRLRVTEERIQAWIDEEPVVDFAHAGRHLSIRVEVIPSQPFGIATWRTTGALRNIELRELAPR